MIPPTRQTADSHRRLQTVFDEALPQEPSAREAYLDRACASDPALRADVVRLLAATGNARVPSTRRSCQPWGEEPFPGTARFRVMRRLGAGGMGVVYEVHDRVRDEVVALKTLLRTRAADLIV
jgi:serine/threonine-protein kinase